jgi:hypothetical protein
MRQQFRIKAQDVTYTSSLKILQMAEPGNCGGLWVCLHMENIQDTDVWQIK